MFWPLGLAQAAVTCPLVLAGDFPLLPKFGRQPVIAIKIGGQTLHMMIDTGAAISTVTTSAWKALGAPPYQGIEGFYVTGVAGYAQLNEAILEDVETPQAKSRDQVFIIADDEVLEHKGKPLVDGSLGYDFLNNFDIGFDLPDHRLSLYFLSRCDTARAPWPGDYDVEPLNLNPRTRESSLPYAIDNQALNAVIDSGSFMTMVAQSSLNRAGVTPNAAAAKFATEVVGVGLHVGQAHLEMFDSVTVGAEIFNNAWLAVTNLPPETPFDILLGDDYLATHRVFISNSTGSVLLGLTVPVQH
jgi:hypothetical protein